MSRRLATRSNPGFAVILAAASVVGVQQAAWAGSKTFTGGTATTQPSNASHLWKLDDNWSPLGVPTATDVATIPDAAGYVSIENGAVADQVLFDTTVTVDDFTGNATPSLVANTLAGKAADGTPTGGGFYMRAGHAVVTNMNVWYSDIGQYYNAGATLDVNPGGTVVTHGEFIIGRLTLSATEWGHGTLNLGTLGQPGVSVDSYGMYVGAAGAVGVVNQNGGTVKSFNPLHVGTDLFSDGTYNLNAGTLVSGYGAGNAYMFIGRSGATGKLVQQPGTEVDAGEMYLASDGSGSATYDMQGGTLKATGIHFGTSGSPTHTFTWHSGTIQNAPGGNLSMDSFVSTLNMQLVGSGTHSLSVDLGQTATQQTSATFSGDGGLTKDGGGALVLAGANTYAGATTINGGTLTLNGSLANSNVNINSGGVLNGAGTLNFNLSSSVADKIIDKGTFDISALNLALGITGTLTGSEYVLADFAGGTLAGSSFASVTGLPSGGTIDYSGTAAHPSAIVLVLPSTGNPADLNHDGVVNQLDLNIVIGNWQKTGLAHDQGDINGDGVVNQLDLNSVIGNWQKTAEPVGVAGLAVVPEPVGLGLIGIMAVAAGCRRRRAGR